MKLPTAQDIAAAAGRITALARRTPVEPSPLLAEAGVRVRLKMEIWQRTGSFKVRGALNRMAQLSATEHTQGIVTASAGNHAQGIAASAVHLQIPATIVVAEDASPAKVAALQRYHPVWVTLRRMGHDYDEAEAAGIALARELGRTFISSYNDPEIIAGQGTLAIELLEDLPDLDLILVPIGGGGLAAGIALWAHHINPRIQVIGVQSEASPPMRAALDAGHLVTVPILPSLADGLAGNIEADSITFPICQRELSDVVLVSETAIAEAMRWLVAEHHVVVEGSGAVGIAALQSGRVTPAPDRRVAVILSGRNVTLERLRGVL